MVAWCATKNKPEAVFGSRQMPDYMMVNGMMMWNLTSCSELNMFG